CCSTCKMPGDDCPLSTCTPVRNNECSNVYHMHCLFKWLGAPMTKQQCPLDRRPW
ncbi:anaphase-promoting complex/cyclosome 11, partial [Pisolithus albus]